VLDEFGWVKRCVGRDTDGRCVMQAAQQPECRMLDRKRAVAGQHQVQPLVDQRIEGDVNHVGILTLEGPRSVLGCRICRLSISHRLDHPFADQLGRK
jgi:hypothetical protein